MSYNILHTELTKELFLENLCRLKPSYDFLIFNRLLRAGGKIFWRIKLSIVLRNFPTPSCNLNMIGKAGDSHWLSSAFHWTSDVSKQRVHSWLKLCYCRRAGHLVEYDFFHTVRTGTTASRCNSASDSSASNIVVSSNSFESRKRYQNCYNSTSCLKVHTPRSASQMGFRR